MTPFFDPVIRFGELPTLPIPVLVAVRRGLFARDKLWLLPASIKVKTRA